MDTPRIVTDVNTNSLQTGDSFFRSGSEERPSLISRMGKLNPLFLVTVALPTLVSIAYFGLIASDVYISESRFVVRSPDKPSATTLGLLLKSTGFANAGDEIYAAQDYIVSRDALHALNRNAAYAKAYSNGDISIFDRFNPLVNDGSFEELFKYYQKRVKVDHDSISSITTLTVRAYTPQAAEQFNEQLLSMAESTVNRLNARGRQDLIHFAEDEVENAKAKSREAALALSNYRNREGVVDPEKQAAVQLQMISKLQDDLISTRTRLQELRAFVPKSPQIPVLETRARELGHQIDVELGKVAGNQRSLSSTAAQFQRLSLDNQFAEKQLASAMSSLEGAQNEARRKQAYIERIVQPNMPDEALEPRRWRGIIATFALGLVAWGILTMLFAGIKEHRD